MAVGCGDLSMASAPRIRSGILFSILGGRHLHDPSVKFMRARRVMVDSRQPWPVQIDGDPIGTTPMTFQVIPRALRVLVPPTAPASLFVNG